jgi:ankyrin repeat protein
MRRFLGLFFIVCALVTNSCAPRSDNGEMKLPPSSTRTPEITVTATMPASTTSLSPEPMQSTDSGAYSSPLPEPSLVEASPEATESPSAESGKAKKELEKLKIPFTDDAMVKCIEDGDLKSVELFLTAGRDINTVYKEGGSKKNLLIYAVIYDQPGMVEFLARKGADISARDHLNNGWTPLHWACMNGCSRAAEVLIARGVDVNAKDDGGITPLHAVTWKGFNDVAEGHIKVAKLLISRGADITARDKDGYTPLFAAIHEGCRDVLELFISRGADINEPYKDGTTPLLYAVKIGRKGAVELLISKGARVNLQVKESGWSPLHQAASQGSSEIAYILVSKGANVNARDNRGKTPLHVAKSEEMKELLRKHGAKE